MGKVDGVLTSNSLELDKSVRKNTSLIKHSNYISRKLISKFWLKKKPHQEHKDRSNRNRSECHQLTSIYSQNNGTDIINILDCEFALAPEVNGLQIERKYDL